MKAAEVNARLAGLDPAGFPSIAEVRAKLKEQRVLAPEMESSPTHREKSPAHQTDLALPPLPPPSDSKPAEEDGGILRRISRLFRRWTEKASGFVQSWQDRLLRAFNAGFALEPAPARSA